MSVELFTSPSIEHQEKIAALPFVENRATAETAQTLRDEMLYQRATQTYLWALPLINTLGMQRRIRESIRRRDTTSCRCGRNASTPGRS